MLGNEWPPMKIELLDISSWSLSLFTQLYGFVNWLKLLSQECYTVLLLYKKTHMNSPIHPTSWLWCSTVIIVYMFYCHQGERASPEWTRIKPSKNITYQVLIMIPVADRLALMLLRICFVRDVNYPTSTAPVKINLTGPASFQKWRRCWRRLSGPAV